MEIIFKTPPYVETICQDRTLENEMVKLQIIIIENKLFNKYFF